MKARANVFRSLVELPVRDAEIVRLRYGFGRQAPATLAAIAAALDLTRQRVHQILQGAMAHLRDKGVTESMLSRVASEPPRPDAPS